MQAAGKRGASSPGMMEKLAGMLGPLLLKSVVPRVLYPDRRDLLIPSLMHFLQFLVLSSSTLTVSRWEEVRGVGNRQCRKIIISTYSLKGIG